MQIRSFFLENSKSNTFSPPQPEPLPDLSQRRSTIGARVSKRSIGGPLVAASSTAGDDQVNFRKINNFKKKDNFGRKDDNISA